MNFSAREPDRLAQDRAIVPMINVVFLLLIFFLMTASLTPPSPFDIDPALAEGDPGTPGDEAIHVAADGRLAYRAWRGDEVFAALRATETTTPLYIRADAALPAAELAALLRQLAEVGVRDLRLLTVSP